MKHTRFGLAVVLGLVPATALAQGMDAFMCPTDLPACTSDVNDCCRRPFSAGTIIIPLDRCHQPVANSGQNSPPSSDGSAPRWCANSPAYDTNAQAQVYGLTFRLLQAGIPVHFIVNPSKEPGALTQNQSLGSQDYSARDIDVWAIGAGCTGPTASGSPLPNTSASCTTPVTHLRKASAAATTLTTATPYTKGTIPFRNALIIDAADAPRFTQFFTRTGAEFSSLASDAAYDFSKVNLYRLNTGATLAYQRYNPDGTATTLANNAPILNRLDFRPPRIARITGGSASTAWLADANLDRPADAGCATSTAWTPSTAAFCNVTAADVQAGILTNYAYDYLWLDSYAPTCGSAASIATANQVKTFLTAVTDVRNAGHLFVQGSSMIDLEACAEWRFMSNTGFTSAGGPVQDNDATGGSARRGIVRYPQNLLTQWGDFAMDFQSGSGGAAYNAFPAAGGGYQAIFTGAGSTLRRLVTEEESSSAANPYCAKHKSTATCDLFPNATSNVDQIDGASYVRYQNNAQNGIIFYTGGRNVNGSSYASQMRMLLNSLLTLPTQTVIVVTAPQDPVEVARSSPVTTEVLGVLAQFLGTYGVYNPALATVPSYTTGPGGSFFFPAFRGHLRAYDPSSLASTGTAYASATSFWDANQYLENLAGDTRSIFTNTGTGQNPTTYAFTTTNASVLMTLLGVGNATDAGYLIQLIRRGYKISGQPRARLGGVDHATAAIIEPSPQTPTNRDRPTVAYVGGLDGMLHAICAETKTTYGCSQPGHELWAFIPRTQLGRLRLNTTRIDGSPKVSDVFDDFDGDGTKEYHTVLVFQTAVGDPAVAADAPTAYGLDITNPSAPVVLWEKVLAGPGLGMAMGPVQISTAMRNLTFITTSVPSGAGATQIQAVDSRTGVTVWTRTITNVLGAPNTAMPGGVAAVDRDGDAFVTDIIATTPDGRVFRFAASTGAVPTGVASPLMSFQDAGHPIAAAPTIWKDSAGVLHALVATGGYVDNATYTTAYAPIGTNQFVVSVPVTRSSTLVLNGSSPSATSPTVISGGAADFAVSYGNTTRAYSQVTIAGGTFFLVTDSDVEPNAKQYGLTANTGRVISGRLTNGAMGTARTVGGGVGGADVYAGTAYTGGGSSGVERETGMVVDPNGNAGTELTFDVKTVRQLWLRLQ